MFAREADEAFALGSASARPYIDLAVLALGLDDPLTSPRWHGHGRGVLVPSDTCRTSDRDTSLLTCEHSEPSPFS